VNWQILVPYPHPEDSLATVGELANTLEADEDCAVARQLVLSGLMAGLSTAGQLVDRIEALDTADRRQLLDAARQLAGLEPTGTVEARRSFEAATASAQITAAAESLWKTCPADGCNAIPVNDSGTPIPVDVKRWWCRAHRHLVAEGDMRPRPSRLRYAPSGAVIERDPDEEAREARAEERRRQVAEERRVERAVEAGRTLRADKAAREALRRELPPGIVL